MLYSITMKGHNSFREWPNRETDSSAAQFPEQDQTWARSCMGLGESRFDEPYNVILVVELDE